MRIEGDKFSIENEFVFERGEPWTIFGNRLLINFWLRENNVTSDPRLDSRRI